MVILSAMRGGIGWAGMVWVLGFGCRGAAPAPRPPRGTYGRAIPPPRAAQPARVLTARGPDDLCEGPNARGRAGDTVLDNRFLRAVIDQVPGGAGFALSGGTLIDLAPRDAEGRARGDALGQVFTMTGAFPGQIVHETMGTRTLPDGGAEAYAAGMDARIAGLHGETVWHLGGDDPFLTLRTTLRNTGEAPVTVLLADAIQWGGTEHFAPGHGFVLPRQMNEARLPWLSGVGVSVAYGFVGETPFGGVHGSTWSNPDLGSRVLAPGESVAWSRRLSVVAGPDPARAVRAAGGPTAASGLRVRVEGDGGAVAGARVTVRAEGEAAPVGMGATDAAGEALVPVAPGRYALAIDAPGRRVVGPLETVTVGATEGTVTVRVGPPAVLRVEAREGDDPVPARVLVRGVDGTDDPWLGPIGWADGARNSWVLGSTGDGEAPVSAGSYEVTVTRGPAYGLVVSRVQVVAGQTTTVRAALRRVVDTGGYVCGDFHQHQAPSLDAPVSLRARARADAAEGLDVAAATDHNTATRLDEAVRAEGLDGRLRTLAGVEVSTDIAARPIGHVNVYPVPVQEDVARGGMPELFNLPTGEFFARARAWAPGAVIQVNHPRAPGLVGMFNLVHLDPATGRADPGFTHDFHALEIWNGRYQAAIDPVLADWLSLLRAGARISPTANSDTHAIVTQEAGWPRTCVAVPDSARFAGWSADDVVRALRETGDVFVTSGPFLRVTDPAGRSALGRRLPVGTRLTVRIEAPLWSAPERLEVLDDHARPRPLTVLWRREADRVRGEVTLAATRGIMVFRARGDAPIPVLLGAPAMTPEAITAAVWGVGPGASGP